MHAITRLISVNMWKMKQLDLNSCIIIVTSLLSFTSGKFSEEYINHNHSNLFSQLYTQYVCWSTRLVREKLFQTKSITFCIGALILNLFICTRECFYVFFVKILVYVYVLFVWVQSYEWILSNIVLIYIARNSETWITNKAV